ncbi:thioesterase family protein [Stappia sp. ES.058]|uniref:acyl-CoA thioesterase n=1 Tax=Stappia sp. ES.058 TaxID=1881061 RepID=UPI00087B2069|nr:thioesterase family protein [Stappia sp. ES.058]SDU10517.1 acyl-CoA thioester hydrolase [Stappia sp. ES.058]
MDEPLSLDSFPARVREKLRYCDTDRQGHVNNAVFSEMLEAGRVALFYDSAAPVADEGCAFALVRLELDLMAELFWPGHVDVGTGIVEIGRSSMTLVQLVCKEDGMPVAKARTVIVQLNQAARRSQPFSDAARAALSRHALPRQTQG